jgi:predicted RND superfamily exporter protein
MREFGPAAWLRWALAKPHATAAIVGAITLLAVAGVVRINSEVGYRAFLGAGHPLVRDFDAFVERFGGGLPIMAVWTCGDGGACADALDERSLAMADAVVRELADVPAIRRLDSPANSPLLVRPAIGLPETRALVRDGVIAADVADLRRAARADPSWRRLLVSDDGKAGAVILHLRDSASNTAEEAYASLRDAVRPHERAGFEFAFVGGPVEFVVAGADLQRNSQRIIPAMVALIAVVLVVLFGAPAAAAAALLCVGLAVVWTLGIMGWIGWAQNSLTQILPPLVLVVGVCDAIHLLGRFAVLRIDTDVREALSAAADQVGSACAMTTMTTVAGFASLAVSSLESIARFGVMAAVAVIVALLLTFTVLPLLVCQMPSSWFAGRAAGARWGMAMAAVGRWTTGRARRGILGAAVVAGVLGAFGARTLEVEASFEKLYGEDSDVVRWATATARALRAPDTLEIGLVAPADEQAVSAAALALVDRVQRRIESIGSFGPSLSIVDLVRHLNGLVHGDELPLAVAEDERGRPTSVYRLLRVRDSSVTSDLVDSANLALRISVESSKLPQAELREALARVERDVADELPAGWTAVVTGPLMVVSRMIDAIRATQLQSFALAAVAVFGLALIFFRSLRLAGMAMVPTVLPVLVTLGVMGWAGIALDIGSAMVAAILLGLAVDDAVHMLWRYAQARREGDDAVAASQRSLMETGRAVVTTSIALAVGFLTLNFSSWDSIAAFGVIAAIAVLCALVAAVLVLPALMASVGRGSTTDS